MFFRVPFMITWEEIVQNYLTRYCDRIRDVTRPIRDRFNIDYFTYHKINNDGHYTVILDRPDWAEHYVNKKFYLLDPYLRNPEAYESGVCFLESNGPDAYQNEVLKDGFELFNLNVGMILIEKSADCVEFFSCSGNSKDGGIYSLYINDVGLLKAFARYFKKELENLYFEMQEAPISLPQLKGEDYYIKTPVMAKTTNDQRLAFLNEVGHSEELQLYQRISPREKDCLELLQKGKTAKESAETMGISPRTIEFYLENIKDKLGCVNKKEILSLTKNWSEWGLL